jgi:beta-phosphoglucomutase-like phosphatase (HAD superfamily)
MCEKRLRNNESPINEQEIQCMNEKLKAKGIFLDLDGTIVDSTEAYIEAARIAFPAVGQKLPEIKTVLEIPRRLEQRLTINDIVESDTKKFLAVYLKTYTERFSHT